MVANTLIDGLRRRLRSLSLGDTIVCWFPNPYGSVGSFESDSKVTILGSGDATEENVNISLEWIPYNLFHLGNMGFCCIAGSARLIAAPRKRHRKQLNRMRCWLLFLRGEK